MHPVITIMWFAFILWAVCRSHSHACWHIIIKNVLTHITGEDIACKV